MSQVSTRRAMQGWRDRQTAQSMSNLIAERDRYAAALEEIRDREWIEHVLDPQWAAGVASLALGRKDRR